MFKEALRELVEKTDGGQASLLMDSSGIALESYRRDDAQVDIDTVGVEFSVVIGAIKRASEMLEAGEAREMVVSTEKMVTLIRMVNDTYFLTLTMSPDGNFGKGRYLMRTTVPKLAAELS
jgi:predicted regulator of Ras-like GTPase activity (Roadblock/LC7/MglB family)